jgi:hypothetical protein
MFVRLSVRWLTPAAFAVASLFLAAAPARAQQVDPCPAFPQQPPADSKPLIRCIQLIAHPVNETIIEAATYEYYIKTRGSEPDKNKWVVYNEESVRADFRSLWKAGFLDNLWIEVIDEPYENGVLGEHVIFHLEERSRVKIVDYAAKGGGKLRVDVSKIEDKLKEKGISVHLDSFVDQATIRRVQGVIHDLYAEKGYDGVTIEPEVVPIEGGTKLVRLTFNIAEGPKYVIHRQEARVADEGQQARGLPVVRHRGRQISGIQVRRRCTEGRRFLSRERVREGARRQSAGRGDLDVQRRQDALHPAAHSRG